MKTAVRNILILLLIAATLAIIYWLIINYYDDKNRTDDAQVDGDIVPVLARTDGFVDSVFVEDDQVVYAGEILLQLDTTDLYLKLRQALNAYEVSKTNLKRSEIGIRSAEIEKKMATQSIDINKAALKASETNYKRNKLLMEKGVVSVQVYEFTEENFIRNTVNLQNAYDKERAAVEKLEDAKNQVDLAHQNIVTQATQIDIIRQDLKYATVRSPVNGIISKRKIQIGQMVRTGAQLFSVVQSQDIWVTANFKETQLESFPIGKKVKMTADAYPKETFTGIVETIGGATGSKFALLPPDNATGNYVKVIQRIPVRIRFEDSGRARQLLRPGFSIVVTQ